MYQALYRKYRPKTFDDVVGQETIIRTLKNEINNNKINHAYLFCGPRGTDKNQILPFGSNVFRRYVIFHSLPLDAGNAHGQHIWSALHTWGKYCPVQQAISAPALNHARFPSFRPPMKAHLLLLAVAQDPRAAF